MTIKWLIKSMILKYSKDNKSKAGGERLLGIPAVIDRMIQQTIIQVISPYFEPIFSPHSYGYRSGKSARHAVTHVQNCIKQGYLRAGIAEAKTGLWFPSDKGVPQDSPFSPLLSNILFDELDKKLTRERLYFARYADDIIILVKSKHIGNQVKIAISRYISKRLKLIVNETKSRVGPSGAPIHFN
jgi:RNA-directed DNA polymerase